MKKTLVSWACVASTLLCATHTQPGFAAPANDRGLGPGATAPIPVSTKRIALVIGNTSYAGHARLVNPGRDAQDLGQALKSIGFELVPANQPVLDASRDTMLQAIRAFEAELKRNPGAVALFYFSGHGIEISSANYLLPLGKDFDSPESVKDEAISAQNLLERMQNGQARASLVILDACRDNPWAKSWNPNARSTAASGGLASMTPPTGFLISFAAQPGHTASDNNQARNGLFTGMLVEEIQKPGLHIYDVFANVRKRVVEASKGKQLPEERNVMTGGALYLAGEPAGAKLDSAQLAFVELARQATNGNAAALRDLERHPMFVQLKTSLNLDARPQGGIQVASASMGADQQSVALGIAQAQSSDPDERALGEAMVAFLRFNSLGRDQLQAQSNAGNRFASLMLERMYRTGVGNTAKDETKARALAAQAKEARAALEKLVQQNNTIALSWLGNHYRDSENQDEQRKARPYFERAAASGYTYAMGVLGVLHLNGKGGVPKDETKAVEWFRKGAEAGNGAAMPYLGWMTETGKGGLPKDEAKAVEWYRKGAEAGNGMSMSYMGAAYLTGKGGLSKDEAKAVEWYRKGAEAGDGAAMSFLGAAYLAGKGGLSKDEAKAMEWYRKAAEAGNGDAMSNLGRMSFHGKGGLTKDEAKAVEWYRKGAEAGNGAAMSSLGWMYEQGKGGLPKDEAKAVEWYRKGAEAGDGAAMSSLGGMHFHGEGGLPKDEAKAMEWFRKGAEAGNGNAMYNLGVMYEQGKGGLPKDEAKAVEWYRKGAEAGDGGAMHNLGLLYLKGKGGLPQDEAKAVEWFRKGAEAGDGDAMLHMGWMTETGKGGLPKDEVKAVEWYIKGAEAGNGDAMSNVGTMYLQGKGGLPKDEAKAMEWYRKGAEAGDGKAMSSLGWMYATGKGGLPKDEAKAVEWYRKGAESGSATSMAYLGAAYLAGKGGLPKDEAQAMEWYRKGAEAGDGSAMSNLGWMYETGKGGLPKDEAKAVEWYRKGAAQGSEYALQRLQALNMPLQ